MARTNLVFNPSYSLGLSGWSNVNGSILSTSSRYSQFGPTALRLDLSTAVGSGVQTHTDHLIPVTEGYKYALSAYALVPSGTLTPPAMLATVTWYDSDGASTNGTPHYFTPSVGGAWTRFSVVDTSPTGAVLARISIVSQVETVGGVTGFTSGQRVYVGLDATGVPYTESDLDYDGSYFVILDTDGTPYVQAATESAGSGDLLVSVAADNVPFVLNRPGDVFIDSVLFEQSSFVGTYVDGLSQAQATQATNSALTPLQPPTISNIQLNADIIIGDLGLNTVDEFGVTWICTDIEGWWGHSEPEIPDIQRGVEDGSYDVTGRYTARQLTLKGVFLPPKPEYVAGARDRLIAATNLVRKGAWLRTSENPTRASFVRLSGRPMITTVNARGRTEFSIGLRAADPVKYEWNDADNGGLTVRTSVGSNSVTATNIGTADVTGIFEVTGPVGSGSTIHNTLTGETMTLIYPLRRRGLIGYVTKTELYNNVATLTTSNPHQLVVGDKITISGSGAPYNSETSASVYTVTAAANTFPYTFSFDLVGDNIRVVPVSGLVSLFTSDILSIDTYERSVSFNGSPIGHRAKIDTLVDWIKLAPGANEIAFDDSIDPYNVTHKTYWSTPGAVTLTTKDAHFLNPGEKVQVSLAETVPLFSKQLSGNIVTLTTSEPHGFSAGDELNVETNEISDISHKSIGSNVATLTTTSNGGFAVSDNITVQLSTTKNITRKARSGGTATLSTLDDHGYSLGDSVTVTLPVLAPITAKTVSANLVSLTSGVAHNFSSGDSVTVDLPKATTVINKATSGASVTLGTATPHGFSVGDVLTVNLPAAAVPVGTRSMDADTNMGTFQTSVAHNFSVGDVIVVDIKVPSTVAVTARQATATTRTITTAGVHNFSVGEDITLSGVSTGYNGSYTISSVSSNQISFTNRTGVVEAYMASVGSVENTTISKGYNGRHIVELIPSATTLMFLHYYQSTDTSSTIMGLTGLASIINETNVSINGMVTVASTPSPTQLTYTKVGS